MQSNSVLSSNTVVSLVSKYVKRMAPDLRVEIEWYPSKIVAYQIVWSENEAPTLIRLSSFFFHNKKISFFTKRLVCIKIASRLSYGSKRVPAHQLEKKMKSIFFCSYRFLPLFFSGTWISRCDKCKIEWHFYRKPFYRPRICPFCDGRTLAMPATSPSGPRACEPTVLI